MFKVIFYKDKNGNEPIKEFLIELSKKAKSHKAERIQYNKISAYIKALQEHGTRIGKPIVKHIDGDLWELRPLNNRIFFFYWKDNMFVLFTTSLKKVKKRPLKR